MRALPSQFVTENFSALFGAFGGDSQLRLQLLLSQTPLVSFFPDGELRHTQPVTLPMTCGWCYMTRHKEKKRMEEDGRDDWKTTPSKSIR